MRKTNSKEARRIVEAYVLDCVSDVLDRCEVDDVNSPIARAYEILKEETSYQIAYTERGELFGIGLARKHREANSTRQFITANTPRLVWELAAANGEFIAYYGQARERVMEWLDETPEEADKFDGAAVWNMYIYLTAAAFDRLYTKENR